jgi:hypothetical protein
MEQRAVTRFFTLKGLKARAIHAELVSVYLEDALALATVKKWHKQLRRKGVVEIIPMPRLKTGKVVMVSPFGRSVSGISGRKLRRRVSN